MADRLLGEQAHLDLAGDPQLLLQPLLLGLPAQQVLDPPGHDVERLGQLAELVAGPDRDGGGEVALAEALRPHGERMDAAGDGAGQQHADEQGSAVHDQERAAHDRHRLHEHVAHVERAGRQPAEQLGGLVADEEAHEVLLARVPPRALDRGNVRHAARAAQPGLDRPLGLG